MGDSPTSERSPAGPADDVEPPSAVLTTDMLTTGQRWLAGFFGLAISVTGAIGTFWDGSNVGGVPLLIVIGALFIYVGITGQSLTRFKFRDAEVTLANYLLKRTEDPEASRAEVQDAVDGLKHLAPDLPPAAERTVADAVAKIESAIEYEQRVVDAMAPAFPDLLRQRDAIPGVNAVLLGERGPILFNVRYSQRRLSARQIRDMGVHRLLQRTGIAMRIIMVVNQYPLPYALEVAAELSINIVVWQDERDNETLEAAIRSMLDGGSPNSN